MPYEITGTHDFDEWQEEYMTKAKEGDMMQIAAPRPGIIRFTGLTPDVSALLTNVPFCPFTEDGECIGGCPDAQHRACVNGEDD